MTAEGRQHQFAAYESCRSNCLVRCDPVSIRFDAYSGRLARSRASVWYRRQRSQACQSSAATASLKLKLVLPSSNVLIAENPHGVQDQLTCERAKLDAGGIEQTGGVFCQPHFLC